MKELDRNRTVRNVTFDNVVVNGKRMTDLSGWETNEYVENVKIK